jgi:phosphoglycolate phosphatase
MRNPLKSGKGSGVQASDLLFCYTGPVMRKHWFFDFDGTLCDTEADIKAAWREALRQLGRPCPDFDRLYTTGPTLDAIVKRLFPDAAPELVEQVRALFAPLYDQSGFPQTRPYPWMLTRLNALRAEGCRLYVATNKRYRPLEALRARLGWETLFDGWYAFDMYPGERLTKGELLVRAMREHGIAPEDGVMVGDTGGDIAAGKTAGLYTIGCTWGYGRAEDLNDADEIWNA